MKKTLVLLKIIVESNCSLLIIVFFFNLLFFEKTNAQQTTLNQVQLEELREEVLSDIADKTIPFEQTNAKINFYFEQKELLQIAAVGQYDDDEDAKIKRWVLFWESRSQLDGKTFGDLQASSEKISNLATNFSVCHDAPQGVSWILKGPKKSCYQNLGIITSLAIDPFDTNTIFAGTNNAGIWKSVNSGLTWQNISDNNISIPSTGTTNVSIPSLGITAIAISPKSTVGNIILYAGTRLTSFDILNEQGIGILKSNDGGQTWQLLDNLISVPGVGKYVEDIKICFNGGVETVVAAGNKFIYRTIDGGINWNIFTNPASFESYFVDVEFNLNNPQYIYASTKFLRNINPVQIGEGAQFFESNDNGITWNAIQVPDASVIANPTTDNFSEVIAIDVTPSDPTGVYIHFNSVGSSSPQSYIKKTYNHGTTWNTVSNFYVNSIFSNFNFGTPANPNGFDRWCHEFEVSDVSANTFFVGGINLYKGIFDANTGAIQWTQVSWYYPDRAPSCLESTHADIRALIQIPTSNLAPYYNRERLFIGNDGGIAKTWNSASYWRNINGDGLAVTQFYALGSFESNDNLVGGAIDNGFLVKYGNTWTVNSFTDGGWAQVDYLNDKNVYMMDYDAIRHSQNGGLSFGNPIGGLGGITPSEGKLGKRFKIDPLNPKRFWCGNKDLFVLDYNHPNTQSDPWIKKTDFFQTGTPAEAYASDITAIGVAASNPDRLYITYKWPQTWGSNPTPYYKFYRSDDGGSNWTDLTQNILPFYSWYYATDLVIDPNNQDRIWISFAGYSVNPGVNRVIFSDNGGISFVDRSTGLPPYPVNCLTYRNGSNDEIYAGTDAGVYRFSKILNQWECFNNNLPIANVTKIDIGYCQNTISISTFGRGIWQSFLPPLNGSNELHVSNTQVWNNFRSLSSDLIIDANTSLTINEGLGMSSGKKIIIKPQATLIINGAKLTSLCEFMWLGVVVENGGTIIIDKDANENYSKIENAQYGIDLLDGSNYAIANTVFDRNFIGVRKTAYNRCIYPSNKNFANVTFDCTSSLKPGFFNQTPSPATNGFAGIYLDHSDLTLLSSMQNNYFPTFKKISNGIIAIESSGYFRAAFDNIHADVAYDYLTNGAGMLGNGVGVNASASSLSKGINIFGVPTIPGVFNNFLNCDYAVCSKGTSIRMYGNSINNGISNGVKFAGNNVTKYFSLHNNFFYTGESTIEIINPNASVSILHNTISHNNASMALIDINHANATVLKPISILDNSIFATPEGVSAVRLTKVNGASILNNNISLWNFTPSGLPLTGIELNLCNSTKISDNLIQGSSISSADRQIGISINSSINSLIKCNVTDNTADAIQVNGSCYPSDLIGNEMKNHFNGIHYNPYGKSGQQLWNGNYWDAGSTCSNFQAVHDNQNVNFVNSSQYKVNNNDPTNVPSNVSSVAGAAWFFQSQLQPNYVCNNSPIPPNIPIGDLSQDNYKKTLDSIIASGNLPFEEYEHEVNLMQDRELFEQIQENPDLLQEAVLNCFYAQQLNSSIAQLAHIDDLAQDATLYSSPLNAQLDSAIYKYEMVMQELNLASENLASNNNPAAQQLLQNNYEALHIQALVLDRQIEQLNKAIEAGRTVFIDSADVENSQIISLEHIDQNEALVNEIYLATVARGEYEFSNDQINNLQSIALECPYGGGPAVYKARGIYAFINSQQIYDDEVTCHEQGYWRKKQTVSATPQNTIYEAIKINILPNPANDFLVVQIKAPENVKVEFVFYNALMQVVSKNVLSAGSAPLKINTAEFTQGIYFYKAFIDSKLIKQSKLTIIHN